MSKRTLLALNAFACAAHVISGGLGLATVMRGTATIAVQDSLVEFQSSAQGAFFRPMPRTVFTIGALTPAVAVEFITAGFHVIYWLALWFDSVDQFIRKWVADTPSANPLRWVEYAITASLMNSFGGINVGITNFYYFLKVLSTGMALQMCGYIIELLDKNNPRDVRIFNLTWNLGSALNITSVGILLYQVFASKTHTDVFYYNVVPFAIWFQTFGIVARLAFRKNGPFKDPGFAEKWYILLSLSTKMVVFWLNFSTFREILEDNKHATVTPGVNWEAVRFTASYAPLSLVGAAALYDWSPWNKAAPVKSTPTVVGARCLTL